MGTTYFSQIRIRAVWTSAGSVSVDFPPSLTQHLCLHNHAICSPYQISPRPIMSHARGLLTPLMVTAIGIGTGKITLSLSTFRNRQLTSIQASRYLTQPSSKTRSRKKPSSTSYPLLSRTRPPAEYKHRLVLTGMSKSKKSTLLPHRPKSRFARRRRLSRMPRELLGSPRMRKGGPKCRAVNSVSLWIRSAGLVCRSTISLLLRRQRDVPSG